jgi:hypothetical protein
MTGGGGGGEASAGSDVAEEGPVDVRNIAPGGEHMIILRIPNFLCQLTACQTENSFPMDKFLCI